VCIYVICPAHPYIYKQARADKPTQTSYGETAISDSLCPLSAL